MSAPQISVIICTYNRATLLARALLAFHEQDSDITAEIIVVDNNSHDDTAETVRRYAEDLHSVLPVTYVHEPKQGLSRARNTGITAARGRILAFLDDDAVPSPCWLAAIADIFTNRPNAAAAGGPIEPEFEVPRPVWLGPDVEGYYSILDLGPDPRVFPRNRLPFGANLALRKSSLGKLRFSEQLGRKGANLASGEEFALLAELRSQGREIYYTPAMHVRHFIAKERLRIEWLMARSRSGGHSLALAAAGPAQRARLVLRTMADDGYWRMRQAFGSGSDPVLRACRQAQYQGVYRAILPTWRNRDGSSLVAETGDDR
ncbi:MAG: glycosyltransferase [Alphaproteobacteria bacterium]